MRKSLLLLRKPIVIEKVLRSINLLWDNQLNLFLMFFTDLMMMNFYILEYSSNSIGLHKQEKTNRF